MKNSYRDLQSFQFWLPDVHIDTKVSRTQESFLKIWNILAKLNPPYDIKPVLRSRLTAYVC